MIILLKIVVIVLALDQEKIALALLPDISAQKKSHTFGSCKLPK
jgi:hypothetical protein